MGFFVLLKLAPFDHWEYIDCFLTKEEAVRYAQVNRIVEYKVVMKYFDKENFSL